MVDEYKSKEQEVSVSQGRLWNDRGIEIWRGERKWMTQKNGRK